MQPKWNKVAAALLLSMPSILTQLRILDDKQYFKVVGQFVHTKFKYSPQAHQPQAAIVSYRPFGGRENLITWLYSNQANSLSTSPIKNPIRKLISQSTE